MNSMLTLEKNKEITKWQKEFRNLVKEENEDVKIRVEKKSKYTSNAYQNGPNSHTMVLTYQSYEKISSRFTLDYPFLICNYTTVDNFDYDTKDSTKAMLLKLSLKYWVEIAKLVGAKLVIWNDYNRRSSRQDTNSALTKEELEAVESNGFKELLNGTEFDDKVLLRDKGVSAYIIELEKNYHNYATSIVQSVKKEVTKNLEKTPTSYIESYYSHSDEKHDTTSFYHDGCHARITVNFMENGFIIEEAELDFKEKIQSKEEIPEVIAKIFVELHEQNRLKKLIEPPRLHTNNRLSLVFGYDWKTGYLSEVGEDVYEFLVGKYSPEELEEWAVSAANFSYISENNVYLFNFHEYVFVASREWYEVFHINEKDKAYSLYREKFLEYYAPKVIRNLQRFQKDSEL